MNLWYVTVCECEWACSLCTYVNTFVQVTLFIWKWSVISDYASTLTLITLMSVWVYVCMLMCLRKRLNMSKWVWLNVWMFVTVFVCEWMCNYVGVQVNPWAYSSVLVCHYTPMSECVSMFMYEGVWVCKNVDMFVCEHVWMCVFIYVNVKPCVSICLCVSEWVNLSMFMWMSTYVRVFVCINM